MLKPITGKIGVKVSLVVNFFLLLVMAGGTYVLVAQQSKSLENELLQRGKIESIVGARMVGDILDEAIDNGVFSVRAAFDTDYQPFGHFQPPKYHTQYDAYTDKALLGVEDSFLNDQDVVFAVAVDRNGYLPTHNTRYQHPITGNPKIDLVGNRSKRIFNDPVGLKAAKNEKKGFLQVYHRDTGVTMWDVSSPIYVKGRHWGGFRIGVSLEKINAAKRHLMFTLIGIMASILVISLVLTFFTVSGALKSLRVLTMTATNLADGINLKDEIEMTRHDEVGEMQEALERLRLSMNIALKRKRQ